MQTRQGNMLESLQNVRTFIDEHAARLSGVVTTGTKAELQSAIQALAQYQRAQADSNASLKSATQSKAAARRELLQDHMRVIARIARRTLPNTPELQPLRMPPRNPSTTRLHAAAYEMAKIAEVHAGVFIKAGLPDGFVAALRNAADRMAAAREEHAVNRVRRGGATKGLTAVLSDGRKIVHVLDAMVQSALRGDEALLASWNIARRVAHTTSSRTTAVSVVPSVAA